MINFKNILVINLMHIGDLLLTTPVLRTLRANYPDAKISLLADKKLADLVRYNENIDECLFLDKKGADNHPLPFFKFILKVRAHHFDCVINLHRNERASCLAAFSGGKQIFGYSKPFFSWFFAKTFPNQNPIMHQIHSHYIVLKESLGIEKIDDRGLELVLTNETKQNAKELFEQNFPSDKKIVAFNIGASWETKRWIREYFAQCADDLLRHGYGVAFFGGTMDLDMVDECLNLMQEKNHPLLKIFTGKLSLAMLAGMLEQCSLMITTDSGPMHVAVAMKVHVLCMFGASPVLGFYPYDDQSISFKSPAPCHPCGIHQCPKKGEEFMQCMKKIPPKVILSYAYKMLNQPEKISKPNTFVSQVVTDFEK